MKKCIYIAAILLSVLAVSCGQRQADALQESIELGHSLLERLCEQYYVYEGTDNLQSKILKEVKSVIEGLREDPKSIKGLEMMLDRNCNGLVARLREQMPKLKADDVKLFIFAACGFSSTTISTILEKNKGIVYNRIWRLKGKIEASEAPDKAEFLDSINP